MSSVAGSLQELGALQKPQKGPAYTRYVNRPLGRFLAAVAHQTPITPNQLSLVSFTFSVGGLVLAVAVRPTAMSSLGVSLLLATGYAMDSADGQLARLRGVSSPAGEWLDHVLDCAKVSLVHLSVLVVMFRYFNLEESGWFIVPMAALVIGNLIFFGGILADQLKRTPRDPAAERGSVGAPGSAAKSLAMLPVDYGLLLWSFSLMWIQPAFMAVYTVLTLAGAAFLVAYLKTWYSELT